MHVARLIVIVIFFFCIMANVQYDNIHFLQLHLSCYFITIKITWMVESQTNRIHLHKKMKLQQQKIKIMISKITQKGTREPVLYRLHKQTLKLFVWLWLIDCIFSTEFQWVPKLRWHKYYARLVFGNTARCAWKTCHQTDENNLISKTFKHHKC